jgi:hypothetical protein
MRRRWRRHFPTIAVSTLAEYAEAEYLAQSIGVVVSRGLPLRYSFADLGGVCGRGTSLPPRSRLERQTCSAVSVNPGRLNDGFHRVAAANRKPPIDEIDAYVVDGPENRHLSVRYERTFVDHRYPWSDRRATAAIVLQMHAPSSDSGDRHRHQTRRPRRSARSNR